MKKTMYFSFSWSKYFIISMLLSPLEMCAQKKLYPIQFSIPENKIVADIPSKDQDFATVIPGDLRTYIYDEEIDYFKDYQRSYFAVTTLKGGWDCLRHYEILANGCIPYFVNLDKCNRNIMTFLPRKLIKEAMNLEGVSYLHIDHTKFNKERYYEILHELLEHTKKYLTTKKMAEYILSKTNYSGKGKILYLSLDSVPEYMRTLTAIGLKELLGDKVVDYPKLDHIYDSYPGNIKNLYGKGFTYSKVLPDLPINRNNLEQRIKNQEFELIIYGEVYRGTPFHDLIRKYYTPDKIVYICGNDTHRCTFAGTYNNLFLREFSDDMQPSQ